MRTSASAAAIRDRIVSNDRHADVVFSGWRSRHGRSSELVEAELGAPASAAAALRPDDGGGLKAARKSSSTPGLLPDIRTRKVSTGSAPSTTFSRLMEADTIFEAGSVWSLGLQNKTVPEVRSTKTTVVAPCWSWLGGNVTCAPRAADAVTAVVSS